jgi:tetratricopeptide (TPR) repeat protein
MEDGVFQNIAECLVIITVVACVLSVTRARRLKSDGAGTSAEVRPRGFPEEIPPMLEAVPANGPEAASTTREAKARAGAGPGDPAAAPELLARLALRQERELGPDDPATLRTFHRLGTVLMETGRFAESRDAFGKAALGRRKTLGPDDASTIASESGLLAALGELDTLADLKARRAVLGEISGSLLRVGGGKNPAALLALTALGYSMIGLEDYAAARNTLSRSARLCEMAFGPLHAMTLEAKEACALAVFGLGDAEGAAELLRQVSASRDMCPETDARDLMQTAGLLASVLAHLGRAEEAEEAVVRAEGIVSADSGNVAGRA